jgi:hypothetical protein
MHTVLHGITRDQFMARYHASHVNVAYAPSAKAADKALAAKAAMMCELGIEVHLCGSSSRIQSRDSGSFHTRFSAVGGCCLYPIPSISLGPVQSLIRGFEDKSWRALFPG